MYVCTTFMYVYKVLSIKINTEEGTRYKKKLYTNLFILILKIQYTY